MLDWESIKFEKTFDVPSKFELSEMISEQSMSHDEPTLRYSCQNKATIGVSHERSVIIQWLMNNYNDPITFFRDIDENGFRPEEVVVGVHPKES